MTITLAPNQSAIFTAMRAFLVGILPSDVEVIQAQVNRVPEPAGSDFVVMTAIRRTRLSTNEDDSSDGSADLLSVEHSIDFVVQLDVHGPDSGDNAQIISTLLRDEYGVTAFEGTGVTPLYTEDPRQLPFQNAEQQYEDRWVVEASLQVNEVVTVPQQYADALDVVLISVDATYPP